jgi:hypothetical protein
MKKLLWIVVLGLLLSSNVYAESLGINKTVNDYVKDNYTIISVEQDNANFFYTLRSNATSKPLVVTCIYRLKENVTFCFKP